MVRAKFRCVEKGEAVGFSGGDKMNKIQLHAVTNGSAETESFFAATPHGAISLGVVRPEAGDAFEVGKEYYVDFTPAGEE